MTLIWVCGLVKALNPVDFCSYLGNVETTSLHVQRIFTRNDCRLTIRSFIAPPLLATILPILIVTSISTPSDPFGHESPDPAAMHFGWGGNDPGKTHHSRIIATPKEMQKRYIPYTVYIYNTYTYIYIYIYNIIYIDNTYIYIYYDILLKQKECKFTCT